MMVRIGIATCCAAAAFDYLENIGIAAILMRRPDSTDALVYAANAASIAKSACATIAVTLVVLIGGLWEWRVEPN
jgi:hypothetical protein